MSHNRNSQNNRNSRIDRSLDRFRIDRISASTRPMAWMLAACFVCLAMMSASSTAQAQLTRAHKLLSSRMPPGVASQRKMMGNPNLANHVQPVRVITPDGSRVSILAGGGTIEGNGSRVTVGMSAGLVYRFKVDFAEVETPRTLYPSIEIVDRLYAPNGLETQFPVPVVINEDDLAQASGGKLVTKVIYLERAEATVPRKPEETDQPWFDVPGGQDPLQVADGLGRPLAILRMGSRVPTAGELSGPSAFESSRPTVLPDPIEPAPPIPSVGAANAVNFSDQ